ncbi:MAG: phosphotransferase system HPr (HPr) family protein [Myxococcota bacterium]|jgi:phosphotransferase system HPr (HPr) family protein
MITIVRQATVAISNGIHARPSHAIVSIAVDFNAKVRLHFESRSADAKSILSVMTLGAPHGAVIEIHATGDDAEAAAAAIVELLERDGEVNSAD